MEKVKLLCSIGDTCNYVTPELGFAQAKEMLDTHLVVVHDKVPVVNRAAGALQL